MVYLVVIFIVGVVAYLVQDKRNKRFPVWLKVICWLIVLSLLSKVSDTLTGIVFVGLIAWWLVTRQNGKKKRMIVKDEAKSADESMPFNAPQEPIKRYVTTPKRQAALAELKSSPQELAAYIDQEIDTFFMNEWTKMAAIYLDQTGQFDEDVREDAGYQMREILDAIFIKFAKQQRAALVEKQSINDELKIKHKEEIDIAMQVYEKWQGK